MTKSELIEKIAAKNPSLTVKEIDRIVTVILDSIINALSSGERVEFAVSAFFDSHPFAADGQKPRTGEKLSVDARNIPHFKAGKQLYELLNKAK